MLSLDNSIPRERSLRAAIEVVRTGGIQELTTRAIARQSGLTQPAIYRHFASKQQLVGVVLGAIRDLFVERLLAVDAGGSAKGRLLATLECFRDFAIDEGRLYDALFLYSAMRQATPVQGGDGPSVFGILVERVRDCGREGSIRPERPVSTALTLVAHVQGLVLLHRQGRFASRERFGDFFERSMDDLLRGLGGG